MSSPPNTHLPSLRRRLSVLGWVLAAAIICVSAALYWGDSRTHAVIEESRDIVAPRILERQRATANLERLIRFGWIASTAADPADWRQAAVTAQALSYHPSLTFDELLRRQVIAVHSVVRQVVAKRERAMNLRRQAAKSGAPAGLSVQADALDLEARELWHPQESILAGLQGKVADDAARLTVERYEEIADISALTKSLALIGSAFFLIIVGFAAIVIRRDLLRPLFAVAADMRAAIGGGGDEQSFSTPSSTEEIAVMRDAAAKLRDALRRAGLREAALRESEQRLISIFEASEAGIVLADSTGRILQANRAFRRMLDCESVIDLDLRAITHPKDLEREADLTAAVTAGEIDHYRLDKRCLRRDGSFIWTDFTIRAARDGLGAIRQFVAIAIDISDRIRAEQELRFIRALVDESADAIYCVDPLDYGRLVWANAAACRHHGVSFQQLQTMRICDWDTDIQPEQLPGLFEELRNTSTTIFETRHRIAGGEIIPVEISATWLEHENTPFIAGYIRDIRERNAMLDSVRRSNEDLQQFAYVASHDLQEPLRMVASFLQLLERRYGGQLDENAREYIGFAVDGAVRMKRLIEDLLAFSRIESRGDEFSSLSLADIVADALDNLTTIIVEADADIIRPTSFPTIMGDRAQLSRLLQNLIGNAVKYRKPDQRPCIEIRADIIGDKVRVSVTDNGIGIAPEYHDRIFMIFQRLHGIGAYDGTGIGLAVCKRIIERHGGTISVASQEGGGAEFQFTLQKGA